MSNLEQLRAISIDPEFEKVCPPLTEDEANRLEDNILADGEVTSPLIVWNGVLLDGHNRRRIILRHPELPFSIKEMSFANRYDAVAWICKNQLGRRNITEQMRAYLIGMQYNAEKQSHGSVDRFQERQSEDFPCVQNGQMEKVPAMTTRERIAKENGVSTAFVKQSDMFSKGVNAAEETIPGIKDKILSGEIRATKKEISAIGKAPKEQRQEMVAELQKEPKDRKRFVTEKTVGCDFKILPNEESSEAAPKVNYDNIIGIIRGAADRMQGTCTNYFMERPELLTELKPQVCEALSNLKHFIDHIFEGGIK